MLISDFDYQLPQNRIAFYPPTKRGQTNLLVLDKQTGHIEHKKYSNLIDYLQSGDVLVLNDTKVIKARLITHSPTGKPKEFLLLESHTDHPDPHTVLALTFGKSHTGETYRIRQQELGSMQTDNQTIGQSTSMSSDPLDSKLIGQVDHTSLVQPIPNRTTDPTDSSPNTSYLLPTTNQPPKFSTLTITHVHPNGTVTIHSDSNLFSLADSSGQVPLPPYIKRQPIKSDANRYQTVFARQKGSVAAPTASLNLTKDLINQIAAKGIKVVYLTLHVGLGTFQPIREDNVGDHHMHSEWFHLPATTIEAIQQAKASGHTVTAAGTTVTRTLEHIAQQHPDLFSPTYNIQNTIYDISGEANIFIYPGYQFQVIDHLLTNFHAPRSTVLMLAAAFSGWPHLKHAYQQALTHHYKFLSYGDSMLIL